MASRSAAAPRSRPNLFGMNRETLGRALAPYRVPAFHAGQIFRWLYARRQLDARQWTDLPKPLRARLAGDTTADPGRIVERTGAADRTVKYRIALPGGAAVEAVSMEQAGRITLCLSSQVGCALDCDFCLTGKMGFGRHLTPGEIAGQLALILDDRRIEPPYNLVFMGMGEPLHNYDGVMEAFRLMTDEQGFGLSRRRITVSTVGLAPAIERLAREPRPPRLAVSLNATTDETRSRLMPVNRKYPLERLLAACRRWVEATGERFTFEYVLLAGVNDTNEDVERLARIVRRLGAKLNLIPFNAVPGWLAYRPPARQRTIAIRDRLLRARLPVGIRWSRGADARAACGQLALLPARPERSDR